MVYTPQPQTAVSRRKLLAAGGSTLAGGAALAALGSTKAAASVDLDVPDAEHAGEDGSVADLIVSVGGAYEFSAPDASAVALTLAVSPPDADDWQAIDSIDRSVTRESGAGEFELSGSVLAHDSLDAALFSAAANSTTSQAVGVRVELAVLAGGSVAASDAAAAQPTVTVENTQAETTAAVTGSGSIDIQV